MTDLSLEGVRLAAEWKPHAATWLSWPHNRETWPGNFEPIPGVWTELVELLAAHEPVHILAGGAEVMAAAQRQVGHIAGVTLHDVPTNDAWTRDHGPMFLSRDGGESRGEPVLLDWGYNAWGGKYPPFDLDNAVPEAVARLLGAERYVPTVAGHHVVLEGGAVESNGQGTVLICESCVIDRRRNPDLRREDFERLLHEMAGVQQVIWLHGAGDAVGIAGDDTDGHIDQLARFVSPTKVVVATESDRAEENHRLLTSLWEQLAAATDAEGRSLELIALPMPRPVIHNGERLPASYANFYVANGVVVAPQFSDPADESAREILAACFPEREIVGFDSRDLVHGLGGVHCVTLNQPVR